MRHSPLRRGFTLIELLVVIAIIAILVALLLPAVQAVREAARRSQCQDHLHNMGIALQNYEGVNKSFPINCSFDGGYAVTNKMTTWLTGILPYVEQKPLADSINPSSIWNDNAAIARTPLNIYLCPSDSTSDQGVLPGRANLNTDAAVTNYKSVAGGNWAWGGFNFASSAGRYAGSNNGLDQGNGFICRSTGRSAKTTFQRDLAVDGTSNTVVVGECVAGECNHNSWFHFNHSTGTAGIPLNHYMPPGTYGVGSWDHNYSFASYHPGGGHFCFGDAKVSFFSENIDGVVYRGLATMTGQESVQAP